MHGISTPYVARYHTAHK